MASNTPTLDLTLLPSYSPALLVIADISVYPTGFNISTPTIEITPPGFLTQSLAFVPQNVSIYTAESLGILCESCNNFPLPDGIWTVKYSVNPAYLYFVEKTFLRVDKLIEQFDTAYLQLDISQCDLTYRREQKLQLDYIWADINSAISAANKCANKQAMELYRRASDNLERFIRNLDQNCNTGHSCNKVW